MALSSTDLGVAFQLCGATGSTLVIFILPGLFYFMLFRDNQTPYRATYSELGTSRSGKGEVGDEEQSDGASAKSDRVLFSNKRSSVSSTHSTHSTQVGSSPYSMQRHEDCNAQPRWKLYAAAVMLGLGCLIVPLCMTLIFLDQRSRAGE